LTDQFSTKRDFKVPNTFFPDIKSRCRSAIYTYRAVVNHPLSAITSLLVLLQPFRFGFAGTVPLARYNQCPVSTARIDEAFKDNCTPIDEFIDSYDIVTNVPNFADVKYFLIGDRHSDLAHQILKSQFVTALAAPGDYLLLEDYDSSLTFDCAGSCFVFQVDALKPETHSFWRIQMGEDAESACKAETAVPTNFSSSLVCRGWDNQNLLKPFKEKGKYLETNKKLYMLNTFGETVQDTGEKTQASIISRIQKLMFEHQEMTDVAQVKTLKEIKKGYLAYCEQIRATINIELSLTYLPYVKPFQAQINKLIADNANIYEFKKFTRKNLASQKEEFLNSIMPPLTQVFAIQQAFLDYIIKTTNALSEGNQKLVGSVGVVQRNQHAAPVLNGYRSTPGRVFGFFGYGHLVDVERKDPSVVEKTDKQYELRKSLEDKPHAILIPKIR
jgi:hypothetical protein